MKKTVLVIEKDESILEIVTFILHERGYRVFSSKTEKGMLEKILELKPDAVLLDIIQVTEAGTELCRRIRQNKITKNIPVIVLSTHPNAVQVKAICADEVLSKPFDINNLESTIDKFLIV